MDRLATMRDFNYELMETQLHNETQRALDTTADTHILDCAFNRQTEYQDLKRKYKSQILMRIIQKEYKSGLIFKDLLAKEEALDQFLSDKKHRESNSYFSFVTINLLDSKFFAFETKHEVKKNILSTIDKAMKKKWISKYAYVLEQRNDINWVQESSIDGNPYKGVHIHILIKINGKKSKAHQIREIFSSFKNMVGDIQKIDVKQFGLSQGFVRWDYLKGIKKDDKLCKVTHDVEFRYSYKFENIYSNDVHFFLDNCQREQSRNEWIKTAEYLNLNRDQMSQSN